MGARLRAPVMPGLVRPGRSQRRRWLRALRITAVLLKADGYHTAYLDEVAACIERAAAPQQEAADPPSAAPAESGYRVAPYPHSRFWAAHEGATLIAVTAYRTGAREVTARLAEKDHRIAVLESKLAALLQTAAPLPSPAAPPVTASERNPLRPSDARAASPRHGPAPEPERRPYVCRSGFSSVIYSSYLAAI